jgi:hypothetical protein
MRLIVVITFMFASLPAFASATPTQMPTKRPVNLSKSNLDNADGTALGAQTIGRIAALIAIANSDMPEALEFWLPLYLGTMGCEELSQFAPQFFNAVEREVDLRCRDEIKNRFKKYWQARIFNDSVATLVHFRRNSATDHMIQVLKKSHFDAMNLANGASVGSREREASLADLMTAVDGSM